MSSVSELRSRYPLLKKSLLADGWTAEDIRELEEGLKADMQEGPGAERPIPIPDLQQRIKLWSDWFDTKIATEERIRYQLNIKRAA